MDNLAINSLYHLHNENGDQQHIIVNLLLYLLLLFYKIMTHIEFRCRRTKKRPPLIKRILIVDDDRDITLTFGVGLEGYYYHDDDKIWFKVYTYNNPLVASSNFKPDFYDILIVDIYLYVPYEWI